MKIIVGLGNPGKEYEKTRHNLGFMFLDFLGDKFNFKIDKKNKDSLVCEYTLNKEKIVFVKPQTYMNLSGNAILQIKNWYKVEDSDIIVIFDDIDIPFGDVRYRDNGSGGTHNGMKSVIQVLGTSEISRIKIGIGDIKHPNQDLSNFVLQKFSNNELNEINEIFEKTYNKLVEFIDK